MIIGKSFDKKFLVRWYFWKKNLIVIRDCVWWCVLLCCDPSDDFQKINIFLNIKIHMTSVSEMRLSDISVRCLLKFTALQYCLLIFSPRCRKTRTNFFVFSYIYQRKEIMLYTLKFRHENLICVFFFTCFTREKKICKSTFLMHILV